MVIGIAGGVGSGKSTVLNLLQKNYPVFLCMADELGHEVMRGGTEACRKIVEHFGSEILCEDGEINRNKLAKIVYRENGQLDALNAIVHPYVRQEIRRKIAACSGDTLFVLESAILFESGCDKMCDVVWGVITGREVRIRRLMSSRGYTREKAESIMAKQMSDAELAERCDSILVNDGEREELEQQIHKKIAGIASGQGK